MVRLLSEKAFAKINLFLRVTGRRADGYHELDSIFVPVSIFDRIAIELRPSEVSSVSLNCNVPSLADADSNLAVRAARAFMDEFTISAQVMIKLEKTIPVGAGLGGGSSDAGTVLRMLAAMSNSKAVSSSDTSDRLAKIAVGLGADVPFFLDPRPSHVSGIGERVAPLEKFPKLHLVLAVPPIEVPTREIFSVLKRENWSGAASEHDIAAILQGEITERHLVNDLEAPAMQLYPAIARLKALLRECGAEATSMTGSGGAVFGIFEDAASATRAAESLRGKAPEARVFVAESVANRADLL
jgi:4-diphosphocytidyl-2-C-methyl-D-erythritol kinase